MELLGNKYWVHCLEEKVQDFVSSGQAARIKDTARFSQGRPLATKKYEVYALNIANTEQDFFRWIGREVQPVSVAIRFWYDTRDNVDRAGVKISREGFDYLFHSPTITGLIRMMGDGGNGKKPDLVKIRGLLIRMLSGIDKELAEGREPEIEIIEDDYFEDS